MEQRKRKIRNILIKRQLQFKYLKFVLGVVIVGMILTGLSVYLSFRVSLKLTQLGWYAQTHLAETYSRLNLVLVLEGVVLVIIAGLLSLKISHRIAGPIYHIEKNIRNALAGSREKIVLRKGDELHKLAELVNQLILHLPDGDKK
jgi:sensor histidine kinase YesM